MMAKMELEDRGGTGRHKLDDENGGGTFFTSSLLPLRIFVKYIFGQGL